jgi:hypothetical protein
VNEDRNPVCGICHEPRSTHVQTDDGDLTHPREARGEGRYELVREGHMQGGGAWEDDYYVPPVYRFVSAQNEMTTPGRDVPCRKDFPHVKPCGPSPDGDPLACACGCAADDVFCTSTP